MFAKSKITLPLLALPLLFGAAIGLHADFFALDPGVRGDPAGAGGPIDGISDNERKFFEAGLVAFTEIQDVQGDDPGLRTFLQDGRDQGNVLAFHPARIQEKNARFQLGGGRHRLEAAPRLAHNFDFFLGLKKALASGAAGFFKIGDQDSGQQHLISPF